MVSGLLQPRKYECVIAFQNLFRCVSQLQALTITILFHPEVLLSESVDTLLENAVLKRQGN